MTSRTNDSALHQSMPLLATSFINRCGTIGMSLLPMLLVEGKYSSAQSSFVMGCIKAAMIIGPLLSGWSADTLGLRFTLLFSFLLPAVGFTVLPLPLGLLPLVASGVVAQVGIASTNTTSRLLLTKLVERRHQKEALSWLKTVNNLAQIVSYALAAFVATIGFTLFFWLDALTSFLALVMGGRLLPSGTGRPPQGKMININNESTEPTRPRSVRPFIGCTLLLGALSFEYEFFMCGIAGKLELLHPETGLRTFGALMVLNTTLCTLLSVHAARKLERPVPGLVLGVLLNSVGLIVALSSMNSTVMLWAATFCLTLGEIAYGALGQFLLIRVMPQSRRDGTLYSSAMLTANLLRTLAATLCFPIYIYADSALLATFVILAVMFVSMGILWVFRRPFAIEAA